jgi:hypothetical protein
MSFTDHLRKSTHESHKIVDSSPFVELIRTNKCSGKIYVNFNKICINIIQDTLKNNNNELIKKDFYKKMYRDIEPLDFFISNNLLELLDRCERYPLEHSYMFFFGLLFGGNLLTKFLPESKEFFKFENPSKLIKDFKEYLNKTVDTKEKQESFIKIVNESYTIIALIFEEFYKKHFVTC